MKKFFEEPVINISCFLTENIITTSGTTGATTDGVTAGEQYLKAKGFTSVDKIDVTGFKLSL